MLRKQIAIEFRGEEGVDAGALKRDFFTAFTKMTYSKEMLTV